MGGGADNIRTPIIYSYVGTGEYGPDHPNVITLDFEPKIISYLGSYLLTSPTASTTILHDSVNMSDKIPDLYVDKLTTNYVYNSGIGIHVDNLGCYAKKSADGKIIYWYVSTNLYGSGTPSAMAQFNDLNYIYYFMIF